LSPEFDRLYKASGRPSIAPEYILRALLLQVFYSVRSERLLVEQIDYNLLFRWFVGYLISRSALSAAAPRMKLDSWA
jgi:transposase